MFLAVCDDYFSSRFPPSISSLSVLLLFFLPRPLLPPAAVLFPHIPYSTSCSSSSSPSSSHFPPFFRFRLFFSILQLSISPHFFCRIIVIVRRRAKKSVAIISVLLPACSHCIFVLPTSSVLLYPPGTRALLYFLFSYLLVDSTRPAIMKGSLALMLPAVALASDLLRRTGTSFTDDRMTACYPSISEPSPLVVPPCIGIAAIEGLCQPNSTDAEGLAAHSQCMCSGSFFADWNGCQNCLLVHGLRSERENAYWAGVISLASSALCSGTPTDIFQSIFASAEANSREVPQVTTGNTVLTDRYPGQTDISLYYTATASQGPGLVTSAVDFGSRRQSRQPLATGRVSSSEARSARGTAATLAADPSSSSSGLVTAPSVSISDFTSTLSLSVALSSGLITAPSAGSSNDFTSTLRLSVTFNTSTTQSVPVTSSPASLANQSRVPLLLAAILGFVAAAVRELVAVV